MMKHARFAVGRLLLGLGIEPDERKLIGLGALTLVAVGWVDVSTQNVAETFFLKRVGVGYLPLAFLISSLVVVAATFLLGRLVARTDRSRLLPRVLETLAALLVVAYLLVRIDVPGIFFALIVLSNGIKAIILLVFWVAAGDVFDGRQAKRLFPPMLAGLTLGTVAGSFASEPIGLVLGIDGLLVVAALVLFAGALGTRGLADSDDARLVHGFADDLQRGSASAAARALLVPEVTLRSLWRESGIFRLLVLAALCGGVLSPMLYFQFSYVADVATASGHGGEQALLALYARLRGWIHLAVLAMQLALTSRMFRRVGVPLSMLLSPLAYLFGFLGLDLFLSLPMGIAALSATRLQIRAVQEPAQRVLCSLFPEATRSRATTLLEGPVDRTGGAIGNVITMAAFGLGTVAWVGYLALPVALAWVGVVIVLWRRYSTLLTQAVESRRTTADADEMEKLFDSATIAALRSNLITPDATQCRAAIRVLADAPLGIATDCLATAASRAPLQNRPLLLAALDEHLNDSTRTPSVAAETALASVLAAGNLAASERVAAVRAYASLARPGHAEATLAELAAGDTNEGVRLAAQAAIVRRAGALAAAPLEEALDRALASEDTLSRSTACRELAELLVIGEPGESWNRHLERCVRLLASPRERLGAARALVSAARRHGAAAASAGRPMLELLSDPDPEVCATALRFAGYAGLREHAPLLIEQVGGGNEILESAAHEALLALGPLALDALLVELWFGKRSQRDAILSIVRELPIRVRTLRDLYRRELASVRETLALREAIRNDGAHPLVLQRLEERLDEGLHTALIFLTAIHDEDRIAEIDELMRHSRSPRELAILIEALETLLSPAEQAELLPLLESRDRIGPGIDLARALALVVPTPDEARRALEADVEAIPRTLATSTNGGHVAGDANAERIGIALQLRRVPIFQTLSTRQLLNLAAAAVIESHPADTILMREGEPGDTLAIIVDGVVEVTYGDTFLNALGAGSFFGEMAVLENAPRSATVRAKSPVRLIRLDRVNLLRLLEELPAIAIGICESLSLRLRRLLDRMET